MLLLEIDSEIPIFYFGLLILSFIISVLILRWALRIDTMVHYMKSQTELLIKIAKHNNVPVDEIYQALGKDKPKYPSVGPLVSIEQKRDSI